MKRFFSVLMLLLVVTGSSFAQEQSRDEFRAKYSRLVSRLGVAGPGIEPHLNRWAAAFPDDEELLNARFLYYYSKCQTPKVTKHDSSRYLGQKPVLELKDSVGNPVYFYEEIFFDDDLYAQASSSLAQAIAQAPDRIDFRLNQISSLIAYEKESPDMALSKVMALVDYDKLSAPAWKYGNEDYSEEDFCASMQEFCFSFYSIGSPASVNAFHTLALKMHELHPKDVNFIDDLGSYYLAHKNDLKKASKYFKSALKINPSDTVAIRNMMLLSRQKGDKKSEAKYRAMLQQAIQPES